MPILFTDEKQFTVNVGLNKKNDRIYATSHTSNKSQNWCRNNVDYFMDKHHWPPNSPDLSPLDFFYWNEAQKNLNKTPFMKIDAFKE